MSEKAIFALIVMGGVVAVGLVGVTTTPASSPGAQSLNVPTPSAVSGHPVISVQVTSTITMNATNGRIPGCNTIAAMNSSQGYTLTVYTDSLTPQLGDQVFCIEPDFVDHSATAITPSDSGDLSVSVSVTAPNGQSVYSNGCGSLPSVTPPGQSTPVQVPQFLQCGLYWDTTQAVDGVALQPGTYRVVVQASIATGNSDSGTITAGAQFDLTFSGD